MRALFQVRLLIEGKPVEYSIFQKSLRLFYAVPRESSGDFSAPRDFYIVKEDDNWEIRNESLTTHAPALGKEIERFFGAD